MKLREDPWQETFEIIYKFEFYKNVDIFISSFVETLAMVKWDREPDKKEQGTSQGHILIIDYSGRVAETLRVHY